jgi:hypothetical protein
LGFVSASEPAAMAVSPRGERIALAWPVSPRHGIEALHLVVLDGEGTVLTDRQLLLATAEPSALRLAVALDEHLHLAWIDRSEGTPSLRHALVTLEGEPASPQQRLSSLDFRVNGLDTVLLPSGDLLLIWSSRQGLVAASITPDGTVQPSTILEAPDSFGLDLQLDGGGLVHTAWQQRPAAILEVPELVCSQPLDPGAINVKATSLA